MSRKCSPDEFQAALMAELKEYTQEIADGIKKDVDTVGREVNETIKSHISFHQHSGNYVKAFRLSRTYEDLYCRKVTWYVKDPEYRLTHLLEKGHALPQGGRSKAYPHIVYGSEIAEQRMIQLAEETIKNAGR